MNEVGVIILAAGLGRRMKSSLPKVMHPLSGKPLFLHVLTTARRLKPDKVAIIIGHGAEAVKQAYRNDDVKWVVQEQQLGTGHAVLCAKNSFGEFAGDILILSGDVPLISERTLNAIIHWHRKRNASLTLLTALLREPSGYGRVLRHADGAIAGIVEEQDATDAQQQIEEVNAGIYVASAPFLFSALGKVKNHNEQGEYYLPDTVAIALKQGERVATVKVDDPREVMGINTREELAQMEKTLQERINRKWMDYDLHRRGRCDRQRYRCRAKHSSAWKHGYRRTLPNRRERLSDGCPSRRQRSSEILGRGDKLPCGRRRDYRTVRTSASRKLLGSKCAYRKFCRDQGGDDRRGYESEPPDLFGRCDDRTRYQHWSGNHRLQL